MSEEPGSWSWPGHAPPASSDDDREASAGPGTPPPPVVRRDADRPGLGSPPPPPPVDRDESRRYTRKGGDVVFTGRWRWVGLALIALRLGLLALEVWGPDGDGDAAAGPRSPSPCRPVPIGQPSDSQVSSGGLAYRAPGSPWQRAASTGSAAYLGEVGCEQGVAVPSAEPSGLALGDGAAAQAFLVVGTLTSPDAASDLEEAAMEVTAELAAGTAPTVVVDPRVVAIESTRVDGRRASLVELDLRREDGGDPEVSVVVMVVDVDDATTPGVFAAAFPTDRQDLRDAVDGARDSLHVVG